MIRRDMPVVLAIESESFACPWDHEEFIRCLRQRNCIGMVAERDSQLVGYMLYELHKNRLHVVNFAVAKYVRRTGVGRGMVEKLVAKLGPTSRNRIMLEVSEHNLDAQLFFKAMGFWAISVLREFYENPQMQDAYLMQYRVRSEVQA
jgi:ribosomal-protein-alanine N-acetyltransferase